MPSQVLPNGQTLSCADLVLFSAFVQWVKQGTVETGNQEDKIRLGFVALILNLACNLYELDPEKHCKEENADNSSPTTEGSPSKSTKQVRDGYCRVHCPKIQTPSDLMCDPLQVDQYAKQKPRHQLTNKRCSTNKNQLYEHHHPCRYHGRTGQNA